MNFAQLFLIIIFSQFAEAGLQKQVLGDCSHYFIHYLDEAKIDFVNNSPWNYDKSFWVKDVKHKRPTLGVDGKSLDIYFYFPDSSLKELGQIYNFKPFFNEDKSCDWIKIEFY